MKGSIKITVTEVTEHSHFPLTKTFTIEEDNTPESIEWWIEQFRAILLVQGFHYGSVNEFIPDPNDDTT
jgi:hypothetical protein